MFLIYRSYTTGPQSSQNTGEVGRTLLGHIYQPHLFIVQCFFLHHIMSSYRTTTERIIYFSEKLVSNCFSLILWPLNCVTNQNSFFFFPLSKDTFEVIATTQAYILTPKLMVFYVEVTSFSLNLSVFTLKFTTSVRYSCITNASFPFYFRIHQIVIYLRFQKSWHATYISFTFSPFLFVTLM